MTPDPLGGDSRDLRTLTPPTHTSSHTDPDQHAENTLQRRGRIYTRSGLAVLTFLYLGCLILAVITDNTAAQSDDAELLYVLAMMTGTLIGGLLLAAGQAERRERPLRALARRNSRDIDHLTRQLDTVIGLMGPLPGRLNHLEEVIEKVPAFGEGVILGAELRTSVLGDDRR